MCIRTLLATAATVSLLGAMLHAGEFAEPAGDVVLTISGLDRDADGVARLDMDMLHSLPATEFSTSSIWTSGAHLFTGVELAELLKMVGATGEQIRAVALNGYAVEIPVSDAVEGGPIVAYAVDGAAMPVRDKGPLWIVYPYDASAKYQTETIYARSIWQLDNIELID